MKHILSIAFCLLLSLSLFSQVENTTPKNSFGLSASVDYALALKLEYKRLLFKDKYELRAGIGIDPLLGSSASGLSLGMSKFLNDNDRKVRYYTGIDLSYERVGQPRWAQEPFVDSHHLNLELFLGLEYNPTKRLSLFLEQDVVDLNFNEQDSYIETLKPFSFFRGTTFGMKYRFN